MNTSRLIRTAAAIATVVAAATFSATASANPFLLFAPLQPLPQAPVERAMPEDQAEAPANFRRQVVDYRTHEAPGTIIIDTSNTHLYFVLGNGKAVR
jgi:lipoprotein-anchoring transpeptidase ErfK/SrfK